MPDAKKSSKKRKKVEVKYKKMHGKRACLSDQIISEQAQLMIGGVSFP